MLHRDSTVLELNCSMCDSVYPARPPKNVIHTYEQLCSPCRRSSRDRICVDCGEQSKWSGTSRRCLNCRMKYTLPCECGSPRAAANRIYCLPCERLNGQEVRHNLPKGWYAEQLALQGGTCGICDKTPEDTKYIFAVDHDHTCCPGATSCGKCVRGLLCSTCNSALGKFGDSPDMLVRALTYLLVNEGQPDVPQREAQAGIGGNSNTLLLSTEGQS